MELISGLDASYFSARIAFYVVGLILCSVGVTFIFHTYIAPEVYELFVKEVSKRKNRNINSFKVIYDCISCLTGIILSFLFYGFFRFEGVKFGTVICALVNGRIIGFISSLMEKHLDFVDGLPLRRYFDVKVSAAEQQKAESCD